MSRSLLVAFPTMLAFLLLGCSSSDTPKDSSVDKAPSDLVVAKEALTIDKAVTTDLPTKVPKIKSIIPGSGIGTMSTQVTILGENFDQSSITLFRDGEPLTATVSVASSVSASVKLEKNKYEFPWTARLHLAVKGVASNDVDFLYILDTPRTSKFHGAIVTKTLNAKQNIASPEVEGKVTFSGVDAGVGEAPKAEIGYGPEGTLPTASNDTWRWISVPFSNTDGEYSVFKGSVRFPKDGSFDLAFRFSIDGGKYWIFADTNDAAASYDINKAAKLTVTVPPPYYCQATEDCSLYTLRPVCDIANELCVECLASTDCTGNPSSFGTTCDTTKKLCGCAGNIDCVNNPNGTSCNPAAGDRVIDYCGCQDNSNCSGTTTCTRPAENYAICR